jgi:hypothetical protein
MDKIIATFNVLCVTEGFRSGEPIWHQEVTGQATVIERPIKAGFISNEGLEHPLVGLTNQIVRFQSEEYLLTSVIDGLSGTAISLVVKPLGHSGEWKKLYTDTPTPKGETTECVKECARQTIRSRRSRW